MSSPETGCRRLSGASWFGHGVKGRFCVRICAERTQNMTRRQRVEPLYEVTVIKTDNVDKEGFPSA